MKDLKISKELIIKVMDIKYPFSDVQLNNNILSWWREDVYFEEKVKINIYEFAYKCKIWVFNKYKIYLSSELGEDSEISLFWTANFKIKKENKSFYGDTEIEAVIKASEYVFKAISNK